MIMGKRKYGGARRMDEVTLKWLTMAQNDNEHWYLILGNDGLLYDADKYVPTTLESLMFYIEVFGDEESLPPYYQKIRTDCIDF